MASSVCTKHLYQIFDRSELICLTSLIDECRTYRYDPHLSRALFQNIFPLAKVSFAEGKMLGAGRHPTGPKWGK